MVVFLVATILVLSAAVAPNLLTEGRREREAETVWRGEQYERAIGKYFQKFGKYPTRIDDLVKQTNGVRFLRQAYTDPMNKADGSWRFIYVGPNGQLIGSVRSQSLLQSALNLPSVAGLTLPGVGGPPAPPPTGSATDGSVIAQPGQQTSQQGQPLPGQQIGPQTGQLGQSGSSGSPFDSQPQPLTGDVLGGNIIGVGSKIKEPSLRVYQGGETYQEWEFIWNPMQQVAIPGQAAPANQQAPTGVPGVQPQPGSGASAPGVPPLTPQ